MYITKNFLNCWQGTFVFSPEKKIKNVKKIIFRILLYFFSKLEGSFNPIRIRRSIGIQKLKWITILSGSGSAIWPKYRTDSLVTAMWCRYWTPWCRYCILWCTAFCGVLKISRNDLRKGKKVITKITSLVTGKYDKELVKIILWRMRKESGGKV